MSQSAAAKKPALSVASGSSSGPSTAKVDMKYLLRALIKYSASDLHIKVGRPPLYRINGKLVPTKMPELTVEQVQSIVYGVLSERQVIDLERNRQIDFSFLVKDLGRFRCNVYFQRGTLSAAIRMIPVAVPSVEELGVPLILKELVHRPRGLILVTGATGSGKSTTLAAMIQHLNESTHSHILTIEDPIEFVYRDLKATITQREVGTDTLSMRDALYAGLRQDPDVIMIGEMRDLETIQLALTAAETGHLVLSTLHTNDARSAIDRILDVFPKDGQAQIRIQLASTLIGIVSQQLVVRSDGTGQVPACEVMIKSPMIESCILKNELDRIPEAIGASNSYYKMQTMNMALEKLVANGTITREEAIKSSSQADDLRLRFEGVSREQGYQNASAASAEDISDDIV